MIAVFKNFWKIDPKIKDRVQLMFWGLFVLMFAYLILKPTRSALFLSYYGPDQLPYLHMLIALVVGGFVLLYNFLSKFTSLMFLIITSLIIWIVVLIIFWYMIDQDASSVAYIYYIWVSLFGVLTGSQFWLMANFIFDVREAKKAFSVIGAGGILGGIAGGLFTKYIMNFIEMESLLLICAGLLCVSVYLYSKIWVYRLPKEEARYAKKTKEKKFGGTLRLIIKTKYLAVLSSLMILGVIISTIIDIQFNTITYESIQDKNELTAFFGLFYFVISVFSFLYQVGLVTLVSRKLGLMGARALRPIMAIIGSVIFLFVPLLLPIAILRMADGGMKTVSAKQRFFLPVPTEIKNRTKIFIDMFLNTFASGFGGLIFLVLSVYLNFSVSTISIVVIIVCISRLFLIKPFQREYVQMFRSSLEFEQINPVRLKEMIVDAQTVEMVMRDLKSPNDNQVLYVLEILESVEDKDVIPEVHELMSHSNNKVKLKALQFLCTNDNGEYLEEFKFLTGHHYFPIANEAVKYYCLKSKEGADIVLERLLKDASARMIGSIIHFTGSYSGNIKSEYRPDYLTEKLFEMSEDGDVEARIEAIRSLKYTRSKTLHKKLHSLFLDEDSNVVREAILAGGKIQRRENANLLIEYLSNKNTRKYATTSLTNYGNKVVGTIADHITNPDFDDTAKKAMIKILKNIGTNHALDGLIFSLETEDVPVRLHILKALVKIKEHKPAAFSFMKNELDESFQFENRYYNILAVAWARFEFEVEKDFSFLKKTILSEAKTTYERIFLTLELMYPHLDIKNAYIGVSGKNKQTKAKAIEYLDQSLDANQKGWVIPMVESSSLNELAFKKEGWIQKQISDRESALKYLMEMENDVLTIFCLNYIYNHDIQKMDKTLKELALNKNKTVRELLTLILKQKIKRLK